MVERTMVLNVEDDGSEVKDNDTEFMVIIVIIILIILLILVTTLIFFRRRRNHRIEHERDTSIWGLVESGDEPELQNAFEDILYTDGTGMSIGEMRGRLHREYMEDNLDPDDYEMMKDILEDIEG
jgi:hypothetical protein